MNFLHEITLTKHFTSNISLFQWELAHLYSYINIFSTEIALNFSEFEMDFGERYLILFNTTVSSDVPGQFVLYQRFFSQYSLDMEDFEKFLDIDTILQFSYNARKKNIIIVGLSGKKIMRLLFGLQSFCIEFTEPHQFLDKSIPFEFEFYNGNSFLLEFKFINTKLLATESDNTRRYIFYFLVGVVVFCFIAIFSLLLITVMLSKKKEELVIQLDLGVGAEERVSDEDSQQQPGSFRVSNMRLARRPSYW
jgi:hypothetical protein